MAIALWPIIDWILFGGQLACLMLIAATYGYSRGHQDGRKLAGRSILVFPVERKDGA